MVVPILRPDGSSSPLLSIGQLSVDHTTQDEAPGRLEMTVFAISSLFNRAQTVESCPVTTRRICRLIACPLWLSLGAFFTRDGSRAGIRPEARKAPRAPKGKAPHQCR